MAPLGGTRKSVFILITETASKIKKIQNIMQREVQDCLRKVEQTQTDMKQEFDSIHEK